MLLGCRMLPHAGFHSRRQQQRRTTGERGRRECIVCQAERESGDRVSRGRRHHEEIRLASMVTCKIWPVPDDHISVVTGRPVSAENVSGVMKF